MCPGASQWATREGYFTPSVRVVESNRKLERGLGGWNCRRAIVKRPVQAQVAGIMVVWFDRRVLGCLSEFILYADGQAVIFLQLVYYRFVKGIGSSTMEPQ